MKMNLSQLAKFLVEAKKNTWAKDGDLKFKKGPLSYEDIYSGYYTFAGQEFVRLDGKLIWTMTYSGGMHPKHHGNKKFTDKTYAFLREALSHITKEEPFRGPGLFPADYQGKEFHYIARTRGDIRQFEGVESITHRKGKGPTYALNYNGCLIVNK